MNAYQEQYTEEWEYQDIFSLVLASLIILVTIILFSYGPPPDELHNPKTNPR